MTERLNCWEYMKCGNGPESNGKAACPVARYSAASGLNHGINGGRICWLIANMRCSETLVCSPEQDSRSCDSCAFHLRVKSEEGLRHICRTVGGFITESGNDALLHD